MTTDDQWACPHFGLEERETTEMADPERRYLKTCRGCGLQYEEFECGRCGQRNDQPKTCACRTATRTGSV